MPLISVLSRSWVAPSLLEFGIVMGLVTPSFPKSAHVFKDVKFELESDLPVSCLVSPSIPLELGLNDSYPVDWHVLFRSSVSIDVLEHC